MRRGTGWRLFGEGGGRTLADEAGVPLLAELPIDPRVAQCGDAGEPIVRKFPDMASVEGVQCFGKQW